MVAELLARDQGDPPAIFAASASHSTSIHAPYQCVPFVHRYLDRCRSIGEKTSYSSQSTIASGNDAVDFEYDGIEGDVSTDTPTFMTTDETLPQIYQNLLISSTCNPQ